MQQRTALVNQIRGQLLEYGIPIPLGVSQVSCRLISIIEDPENELTVVSRELLHECWLELTALNAHIRQSDKKIIQLANNHPVCLRLMAIPGIGPIIATALIAAIGNANTFKNGRELSAWLGLVPKQYSTGGQQRLLGISKRGDRYVRSLFVQGAISAITRCKNRQDNQIQWARQLREIKGLKRSAVALANKMARIVWSVMARDHDYVVII